MACPWYSEDNFHSGAETTPVPSDLYTHPGTEYLFASSGGYFYHFCQLTGGTPSTEYHFHRGTTADYCTPANWTIVGAGELDSASNEIGGISTFQVGDVIHFVFSINNTTTTNYPTIGKWYNTFGMHDGGSEAGWGTGELVVESDAGWQGIGYNGLHVRSNGEVVCVLEGPSQKIMGTDYSRGTYAERSTGGTWTVASNLRIGDEFSQNTATCVPTVGDDACLVGVDKFSGNNGQEWRKLAGDGTLGSIITGFSTSQGWSRSVEDSDGDVHTYVGVYYNAGEIYCDAYLKNFVFSEADHTMYNFPTTPDSFGYLGWTVDGNDLYLLCGTYVTSATEQTFGYLKSSSASGTADRTWAYSYTDLVVDSSVHSLSYSSMVFVSTTKYSISDTNNSNYEMLYDTPIVVIPPVLMNHSVDFVMTKIYDDMSDYGDVLDPAVQDGYGADLYILTWHQESTYGSRIQMWKCVDGDDPKDVANWSEAAESLTLDIEGIQAIQRSYGSPIGRRMVFDTSGYLHIVVAGKSSTSSQSMFYRQFNTATDAWVTAEAVTLYDDVSDRVYDPQIAIRPSSDQPIIQTGLSDYSPFTYIGHGMSYRTGVATWTSTVIDSSSDGSSDHAQGIVCADDMCYLYVANYGDVTPQVDYQFQACYYSFNSSNSLGSRTQFTTYTTTGRGVVRPFYVATAFDGSVWRHLIMTSEDNADVDSHDVLDLHIDTGAGSTLSFTTNTLDTHPSTTWHQSGYLGQQTTYNTDLSKWEFAGTHYDRDDYPPNVYYATIKFVVNESGTTGSYYIQLLPWALSSTSAEYYKWFNYWHKIIKRDGSRYIIISDKTDGAFYDELLFDTLSGEHDVDFMTSGVQTVEHDIDFILFQLTKTIDHDIDFQLYDPDAISPTVDHLVDGHLVDQETVDHTIDALLIEQPEVTHGIDFVLIETTQATVTHAVDFVLTGEVAITTTMTMTLGVSANQSVELPPDVTGDKTGRKKHPTPKIIK